MASTLQQLQAFRENMNKQLDKLIASCPAEGKEVEIKKADVKITPLQKFTKQLEEQQSKLTKLNEKIAGGKSKIPDKDEENKTKLEEKISEIQTKISELIAKESEPKPEKKAKAPNTEAKAEAKHIPRITPAMTKKLKDAFETVEAPWDDKYNKDFVNSVNCLSEEDFAEYGLEGHMSKFANMHAPSAAGGGGGGGGGPSIKSLAVTELHKLNKNLKQVSIGVYQHKTSGEMFTGPAEDTDEEFEDADVDGVKYVVGQTTKRVYITTDGPDEFVGYWSVGKFYDADL
jgi:uncharacterized phage infection (PIP) family protein YhgE